MPTSNERKMLSSNEALKELTLAARGSTLDVRISKISESLTFILSNLNNFYSLEVVDRVNLKCYG